MGSKAIPMGLMPQAAGELASGVRAPELASSENSERLFPLMLATRTWGGGAEGAGAGPVDALETEPPHPIWVIAASAAQASGRDGRER